MKRGIWKDVLPKSTLEIEKGRKRKLYLATLNLNVIYFVFLGIVVVSSRFFIPEIFSNKYSRFLLS
jgi:hypothetical protein